jgi:hypothetical protein
LFMSTIVMSLLLLYEHRVMAGPISQQPQHTPVLEMAMLWSHVLVYLFKILSLCSSILRAFMVLDA